MASGVKKAFSFQEDEIGEGAEQYSGGADQSSWESAEWSRRGRQSVGRVEETRERQTSEMSPMRQKAPNSQKDAEWLGKRRTDMRVRVDRRTSVANVSPSSQARAG